VKHRLRDFLRDASGPFAIATFLGLLFWVGDALFVWLSSADQVQILSFEKPVSILDALFLRIPLHDLYIRLSFLALTFMAAFPISAFLYHRRLAEGRLARVSSIIEGSPVVALEWTSVRDGDIRVDFVTDNVEQLSGYKAEEFVRGAVKPKDLLHSADRSQVVDDFLHGLSDPQVEQFSLAPYRIHRKDGEMRWVDQRTSVQRDRKGSAAHYNSTLMDITEQIEMESRLQEQQKLESIGTLSAGVAHEINNPLTGVINYAELIRSRVDDETLAEYAANIGAEGDRIARIVSSLLTYARRDDDVREFADMRQLLDDVLTLVAATLRKHQIAVDLDVPDHVPEIVCNHQGIEQVLINLVMNARDALNAKYPSYDENKRLAITMTTTVRSTGSFLRVTVEDHGNGIPEEIQAKIFDPFYSTKARTEGTGLGLAISLGIVRTHNGWLTFESEPGHPTRFHLDLPIDAEVASSQTANAG